MTARPPYRIGVIPGDGIGPEVIAEGLKVLGAIASVCHFSFELTTFPWSGQHYLDTGEVLPERALDDLRALDAVYLGALGDPRVPRGLLERQVLLAIRFGLDLYVNLRPIVLYAEHLTPVKNLRPADLDIAVVRENTEDAYAGIGGTLHAGTPAETTMTEMVYTRFGVERVLRYAFDLARRRNGKRRVTLVDKSNAIAAHGLWRRVFTELAAGYPDIETDAVYVDAAAMYLITNPSRFDVLVTTNLFGDILTDLGAAVQGGLGSAASGNLNPGHVSLFEPIHGSAPDIAGLGTASPLGAIAALAMMLHYLGEERAAGMIDEAIRDLLQSRRVPTLEADSGLSTVQQGDLVVEAIMQRVGIVPA